MSGPKTDAEAGRRRDSVQAGPRDPSARTAPGPPCSFPNLIRASLRELEPGSQVREMQKAGLSQEERKRLDVILEQKDRGEKKTKMQLRKQ